MIEPVTQQGMADAYRSAGPTIAAVELPRYERIIAEETKRRGVDMDALRGPNRERPLVWHRQEIIARIHRETSLSLPQIGRLFSRDHTTVLHSIRAVKRRGEMREDQW